MGLPGAIFVTSTLTWTPSGPGDTSQPPPTLDVLETASAGGAEWMLQPTGVVATTSDGFNDPVFYATAPVYGAQSKGNHLYHLTISPGQTLVTLPQRTMGASISYATAITTSSASIGMGYTAQEDKRSVSIVGGRVTYKKLLIGGLDANGDGLWKQVMNQSDANGNLSDDIAIPYGEKHNEVISGGLHQVDSTSKIDAVYSPLLFGPWATEGAYYLENSSAKNYNLQGTLGDPLIDIPPTAADIPKIKNTFVGPTVDDSNSPSSVIWNDAGVTDHIFFKFTNGDNLSMRPTAYPTGNDGDKAIASANYYLNIHRPLESFLSHVPSMTVYRIATAYPVSGINSQTGQADIPLTVDTPGFATYGIGGTNGATVAVHFSNPDVNWDHAIDILAGVGSLPFPGELAILDQVFTGASILVHYNKPDADTQTVAFNNGACWTDPWSTGQGAGLKSDYHMFPRFRVRYTRTYSLVDSYNMDGFQTETLTYCDKFKDNFSYFGYFQYVGNAPQP